MPLIDAATRQNLEEKSSAVYSAYVALNLATDPLSQVKVTVNGKQKFFNEYLQEFSESKDAEVERELVVDGLAYKLKLVESADRSSHTVQIQKSDGSELLQPVLKPVEKYSATEAMALWARHPIVISKKNPKALALTLKDGESSYLLGGPDKIPLYRIHLENLYGLIQRLKEPNQSLHTLFEMATGSGKSFTQGLLAMAMKLAGVPAKFAVPSEMHVDQLRDDFNKLFPAHLEPAEIMTHEQLLTVAKEWEELQVRPRDQFLVIDEQQEAMQTELLARRLKLLADRYPLIFLSATPTAAVFDLIAARREGEQAADAKHSGIVQLSQVEKQNLGMAKRAKNTTSAPVKIIDALGHAKLKLSQRLMLAIVESLEPERTSPAHNYVREVEKAYYFRDSGAFCEQKLDYNDPESIRRYLRWNIESPLGERALVHATRHDTVVNLAILAQKTDMLKLDCSTIIREDAFRGGNRVPREDVYNMIRSPDLDAVYRAAEATRHQAARQQRVMELAFGKSNEQAGDRPADPNLREFLGQIDFSDHRKYLKYRVFHGLVEKALSFLTGWDSIRLDRERFDDLKGLMAKVKEKLGELKLVGDYGQARSQLLPTLEAQLKAEGLEENVAHQVAGLVFTQLWLMQDQAANDERFKRLVDNWPLDRYLHEDYFKSNEQAATEEPFKTRLRHAGIVGAAANDLVEQFHGFIDRHAVVYVMKGLEKSETAIPAGQPFYGLKENFKRLDPLTSNRKLGVFEQLNPLLFQFSYQPLELKHEGELEQKRPDAEPAQPDGQHYTAKTVDSLFKMGMIGCYVTDDRCVGFNDPRLQHVGILIDDNNDPLNQPDMLVQGAGRLRGLMERRPFCFTSTDHGVTLSFNLEDLEKEDARARYWKAKKAYHQQLLNNLKVKLSAEIQACLEKTIDAEGEMDQEVLQKKCVAILLNGFEKIYNDNGHDFNKTRDEFTRLVRELRVQLYQKTKAISSTFKNPVFVRVVGAVLYVLGRISLFFKSLSSYKQLKATVNSTAAFPRRQQSTYVHLVTAYDLKRLVTTSQVALKFGALIGEKLRDLVLKAVAAPSRYMKDGLPEWVAFEDNFKNKIVPIMLQNVESREHQVALQKMISEKSWLDAIAKFTLENKYILTQAAQDEEVSAQFKWFFLPLIVEDREIAEYIEANQVKFSENVLKSCVGKIKQAAIDQKQKGDALLRQAEMKGVEATLSRVQERFRDFLKTQKPKISTGLQQFGSYMQEQLRIASQSYQQQAEGLSREVSQKIARRYETAGHKNLFSKAAALFRKAKEGMGGKSKAMSRFFVEEIIRDSLYPLLDRRSKDIMDGVLNKSYDWSVSLLANRKKFNDDSLSAHDKFKTLVEESIGDAADKAAVLGVLEQLQPRAPMNPLAPENPAEEKEQAPDIAQNAVIERLGPSLKNYLLPKLLTDLFAPKDKAVLEAVLNRHDDGSMINDDNLQLFKKLKQSLQPEARVDEAAKLVLLREFLRGFFSNLVKAKPTEPAEQAAINSIFDDFPFSSVSENLLTDVFPTFAGVMEPEDGARFLELTQKYKPWGRQLCEQGQAAGEQAELDLVALSSSIIDGVVTVEADKRELQAIMAKNNKEEIAKNFFLEFVFKIKNDVLALLPVQSPIKQFYEQHRPSDEAVKIALAGAYEPALLAQLNRPEMDDTAKIDFVAAFLGKAFQNEVQAVVPPLNSSVAPVAAVKRAVEENKKFAENIYTHVDKDKLRNLLIKHFKPIIGDKLYKKMIADILGPLDKWQLEDILSAVYPRENSRDLAVDLIDFRDKLLTLPVDKFLEHYLVLGKAGQDFSKLVEQTPLFRMTTHIGKILGEIMSCQQYFHCFVPKGPAPAVQRAEHDTEENYLRRQAEWPAQWQAMVRAAEPQLKQADPQGAEAEVWKQELAGRGDQPMGIQIKQLKGLVDAFPAFNRIEEMKAETTSRHVLQTADALGELSKNLRKKGLTQGNNPFALFARVLKTSSSLTEEEVKASQPTALSAVHKMRRTMRRGPQG